MNKLFVIALILFVVPFSCTKADKAEDLSVRKGKISIAADESFKFIAEAEVDAYKAHYPEAEIEIIYTPEQKAIGLMLSDSVDLAIVSRELSDDEQRYYTSRNMTYMPGKMALDAVALIVNKNSEIQHISTKELAEILRGTSTTKTRLVFDNSSSSNLNLMLSKFDIDSVSTTKISAAKGTEDVFDYVNRNENSIGVIGFNWISDVDDKRAKALRNKIRLIPVGEADQSPILPSLSSLKAQSYPLIKTVYLHTTQDRWGVAKGFVRFSCSQIGQLVVEKMDLQPYYLIPKRYLMSSTDEIVTKE